MNDSDYDRTEAIHQSAFMLAASIACQYWDNSPRKHVRR
jgi:hypothetical protein